MILRNVVFFFLLTSIFWIQSTFGNEHTQANHNIFPTFKETTPISPEDLLLNGLFEKNLYDESQSFSQSPYWHKLTFPKKANTTTNSNLNLNINFFVVDQLDFYLFHGDKLVTHWKRGAFQTWNNTESYKGIWIPISLSADEQTTLLLRKAGNSPLLTPIKLYTNDEAVSQKEQKMLFWAIIICSLCVLLAHNIFVFILLRQPGYIYYLGINVTIFISLSITSGFNRWIFPEEMTQWTNKNLFLIFGMGTWIFYRYSLTFLKEVQVPSSESLIRKYGDLGFIAFLVATQLFSEQTSALLFALIEVVMFVTCTYWGIQAYLKGFLAARFYLFSWIILILGSIASSLIFWQILPINLATDSILPICSLLQLLGFAFAFADKANYIEHKRYLQAITDPSTGLPNRTYYFDKLPILLSEELHREKNLALIMIEITSHLKLSQAFGPAQADIALSSIAERIHKQVMTMDGILPLPLTNKNTKCLMRFTIKDVVIVSTTPDALKQQIEQIQTVLDHSVLVNKIPFRHQYKIGSALYPSQGTNLDQLYRNALIACNTVTYSSGNWAPFTDKLQSNHAHQLKLITLLTDDIQNEKLYFDIQPQVDLSNNRIVGGEILLRWHNQYLGQVSPAEFISLAEQTGLIYKLTNMVIEKAFQWAAIHTKTLSQQTLSINISALDLLQENFAKDVSSLIQKYNLNAKQFTIEITETSVFQNNEIVTNNTAQLHQAGFKLSIDDFGVGYSSMQNLISLQTNELKIDQFFVMNLINDKQSQALCQNMIHLSKELNITNVAEGIESEEILKLLQSWNCQIGQGYHLYRPMTPANYLSLLKDIDEPLSPLTNNA